MKAKTFIEYWKSPVTEVMSIHKAYDLLSRPFKPEDITELFEGWEHWVNYSYWLFSPQFPEPDSYGDTSWTAGGGNECKLIDFETVKLNASTLEYGQDGYDPHIKYSIFKNKDKRLYDIRVTTIDQFISDCTRSCIELIWKEEIVNQYFK